MITETMWAQAHAIANAHGHMWATSIPAHLCPVLWGTDLWRAAAESGCAWPCGRAMPAVDGDSIGDSTATGRLAWAIFDGKWTLAVTRPEIGRVLCADSDGYVANHEAVRDGAVHIRHLDALVPALKALGQWRADRHCPDWAELAGRFAADMDADLAASWFAQLGAEHGGYAAQMAAQALAVQQQAPRGGYHGRVVDDEI